MVRVRNILERQCPREPRKTFSHANKGGLQYININFINDKDGFLVIAICQSESNSLKKRENSYQKYSSLKQIITCIDQSLYNTIFVLPDL